MSNFINSIIVNALYEIKILLRSWFFRIFSVISILTMLTFDILFFSSISPVPRFMRGLDSFLPYMNSLLPHFMVLVLIVFLTTDLYKRDNKYNTSDVIYIRNMSNVSFFVGRIAGLLLLFIMLEGLLLVIAAVINLFFSDLNFIWQAYLLYPALLSFPSMVFVAGLTFFLMHVIRNQAVVVILVLGILVGSVLVFFEYGYLIWDIVVAWLPFTYSDFIGLGQLDMLLYQRLAWFVSGLFLLFLSVLFAKRLPQSKKATYFIIIFCIVSPLIIAFSFYKYISYYKDGETIRTETREQLLEFSNRKTVQIINYDLDLEHLDNEIRVTAGIQFKNNTSAPIDTLCFLLNRGLNVLDVTRQGATLPFMQSGTLVYMPLSESLPVLAVDSLRISYQGWVDERSMFAHIRKKNRPVTNHIWLFRTHVRHAIISKDYLLLPPNSIWYPRSFSPAIRDLLKPFVHFSLNVKTNDTFLAVSQGAVSQVAPGSFYFKSDKPAKELSLVAGPYMRDTVQLDSIDVNFFSLAKHDYYKTFFKEISDTLPSIIQQVIQDFETKVGQDYPFNRLNLVEVPVHFYSYQQNGRESSDFIQAEQIWIPENAATLTSSYFKTQMERRNRFGGSRNQTFTELEKEIMLFKRFAQSSFTGSASMGFGEELFSFVPDLNAYPLFMNFSLTLSDIQNEGLAIALEANHKEKAVSKAPRRYWTVGELTDQEKANIALADTSLQYIMKNAPADLLNSVLVIKGSYLLKQIENVLGEENFDAFMQKIIKDNLFKTVPVSWISAELSRMYGYELDNALNDWFTTDALPGYQFGAFDKYQIRDDNQLRYQVLFHINNPTATDGLVEVSFTYPGESGSRFMNSDDSNSDKWLFRIKAGEAQQIGLVVDSDPRTVKINTLVSQNLPSVFTYLFEDSDLKANRKAIEGQKVIDWLTLVQENKDLIIDNTTDNFEYLHPQYRSQLKAWIYKDSKENIDDFSYFRWWRGPSQWQKLKFPSFYGEFVHSAYYARSGQGERKATWLGPIPADGLYEIYVYVPDKSDFSAGRHRDRDFFGVQKYMIHHADGMDEVELDFSNAKPGWSYLETYFFKEGQARIELTDETDGRMVFADAVKWELKD